MMRRKNQINCSKLSHFFSSFFKDSIFYNFQENKIPPAAQIMADIAKQIQYADEVIKLAGLATAFSQECLEIKSKTGRLAALLRQAARASGNLYERPARRIIDDTEQVLHKALTLVFKCRNKGLRRFFTIIPAGAFRKISIQLSNSIGDVSWLLRVSTPADDDGKYLGLPPITVNEPILCLIWDQIAILCSGLIKDRTDSAAMLVSLARENDLYRSLIIEEGGVPPLLKLAKEGRMEGQENAARAIGLLGRDPESVEQIVNAGACQVFAKILEEGHMKVQVVVAWAVSELAAHHRKCQDPFAQNNIIGLLVNHLTFETIPEHSKYAIMSKQNSLSIHPIVFSNSEGGDNENDLKIEDDRQFLSHIMPGQHNNQNQIHNVVTNTFAVKSTEDDHHDALAGSSIKKHHELEDPATKAEMKSMAARALRYLCAGNVNICKSVTESGALLCLAVLLEMGPDEVKYNSAMALMEITAVAEHDLSLRRSAFNPTAPVAKAIVDQFLNIIEKHLTELTIPSIRSIGNLAITFRETGTRFIQPLVHLLDEGESEPEVTLEVALALNKFVGPDKYLHDMHCNEIIKLGGVKHLTTLVYFGEGIIAIPCFILVCYLALNLPDSKTLAQEDVLNMLEWATKQRHMMQDKDIGTLAYEAKKRLELYQSRGSIGYH
ncbi:hypothetical protein CASFOL_027729 [Castilleja foliolosa]|uniref:DUF7792 domain-containing protein n=1 Tax=Castilleja foliolosa TaxID=1961234 RepID=A0ABD3CGG2_9LAMI